MDANELLCEYANWLKMKVTMHSYTSSPMESTRMNSLCKYFYRIFGVIPEAEQLIKAVKSREAFLHCYFTNDGDISCEHCEIPHKQGEDIWMGSWWGNCWKHGIFVICDLQIGLSCLPAFLQTCKAWVDRKCGEIGESGQHLGLCLMHGTTPAIPKELVSLIVATRTKMEWMED
jgi:hypothetical protein